MALIIIWSLRKCRLNKYFRGFTPLPFLDHYEALNYSRKYQRQKICISSESLKIIVDGFDAFLFISLKINETLIIFYYWRIEIPKNQYMIY